MATNLVIKSDGSGSYQPCLFDEEENRLHLYKVELQTTVYVLAQTYEDADSQAKMNFGEANVSKTTQIPFRIRGWGDSEF